MKVNTSTMKGRGARSAAVGLALVLCLAGCGSSASGSGTGSSGSGDIKIGDFGPLTGPDAQDGINPYDGVKLAVSQYNATNPAHKVTVVPFDSQGDSSQANDGATTMINDKVVAVIGPDFSGPSKVADPIFEQAGIPTVSPSATNTQLATNSWKYFHRDVADDSAQGPADANYLVKTLGDSNVAVIDDSSTYGQGLADAVRTQLKSNGGKDVLDDHVDPKAADYGATVNKIISANPSAVFYGGYYDAAGRLVNQLKAAGYKGAFMSGDGSETQQFVTDAGGAPAEGSYLSCACADTSTSSNPAAQSFYKDYTAMFKTAPGVYSAEGYDAANAVLAAIKAGNTTASAINTYLSTINLAGVTKTIQFQPDGNIVGSTIYEYKVENGKIVEVGTSS